MTIDAGKLILIFHHSIVTQYYNNGKAYYVQVDMYIYACSPTGTSQTYTSGEEANGAIPTDSQCDKVVYAAPAQIVAVPHQASATGDMYAVSTKAVNRKSQEEPLKEQPSPAQEDVDISEPKKLEGVSGNT